MRIKHLNDVGLSYWCHFWLAMWNAFRLFLAAMVLGIHAVFPFLFLKTASNLIEHVQASIPKHELDRILVRFNTKWQTDPEKRQWRVLVNGEETLAHKVEINVRSETIQQQINGEEKFHFLCFGRVAWIGVATVIAEIN